MQPLSGLSVLDFSTLLPGPMATLMLAEAGADVLKIERPGGEDMRRFPPRFGEASAAYAVLNRGKRVIFEDLKDPGALERLRPRIEAADVLVEQFRPGVMERLGFGYEALSRINPRLIYCSITGYGQDGPRAAEAGHDLNYQAVTGLLGLAPGRAEAPAVPAALAADIAGGSMPAVINILLALRQRDLTGAGCRLDIAMADAMFTFGWLALAQGHASGRFPAPNEGMLHGGLPRYGVYATADGRFLAVGALEEKFWTTFCDALELPQALRRDHVDPDATRAAVAAIIRSEPAATWARRLGPLDCCCTVVASLEEALADPHFRARGLFDAQVSEPGGRSIPAAVLPIAPAFRQDGG
ncbi:CaiB/BaiF CoA-transferase family protein [Alsobacter sp. KACC 23698]|uniref:CaiB/BaiF CoA-transferase family protein n=1 Tax=Alsobacter sp. KACC 23698 TaxID=3149229 RepID=A0AAU7JL60_9HYPH